MMPAPVLLRKPGDRCAAATRGARRSSWRPRGALRLLLIAALVCATLTAGLSEIGCRSSSAAASPANAKLHGLLARLQSHYQEIKSFRARFTERVTRPGAPPLKRLGVIYYQKPSKLRWQFQAPQPETIVSDGKLIYDYDPGLNQVVETPLQQAVRSQAAAAFLLGAGSLQRDFDAVSATPRADGLKRVVLTPKAGGESVEIAIDPATYNIVALTLHDPMGNRTELHFTQIELNAALEASLFEFSAPTGADIVNAQGAQ